MALDSVMIDGCWYIDTEYVKTSVTDIQYNLFNMLGKEKKSRTLTTRRDRINSIPPTPRDGVSPHKNCHPGNRRDARLARCVYALELPVHQLTYRQPVVVILYLEHQHLECEIIIILI